MKRKAVSPSIDLLAEQRLHDALEKFQLVELRLKDLIPWEMLRESLSKTRADYSRGGRPPYDEVFMFKCLILQVLYGLSDESLEIEIYNRFSFRVFLGMNLASDVPDRNTIWKFRERLTELDLMKTLFDEFGKYLEKLGLVIKQGTIIDSTFVEAPRQQNPPEINLAIREDKPRDEIFKDRSESVKRHKDTDARWAKKRNELHYGYKNHTQVSADAKVVIDYKVTPANAFDGNVFLDFYPPQSEPSNATVWADSAYNTKKNVAELTARGYCPELCEKGCGGKPLTDLQRENNHLKSKKRCRVEHVYAAMTIRGRGLTLRTIGIARAKTQIGLINLSYNMRRYLFLSQQPTVEQCA